MAWNELRTDAYSVEIEADSESPDMAAFSNEQGRAVLVLNLRPNDGAIAIPNLIGPIRDILGASIYSNGLLTRMSRILPLQHPLFPWMFATEITSIQGRGQASGVRAYHRRADTHGVNWQYYRQYRFVVVFSGVKYAVKKDEGTEQSELYRYVERYHQLGLENIIRPGNSFRWVNGTPPAGATIPFGFVARAPKGVLTYVWKNVTRFGLFGANGVSKPKRILDGLGKVNETTFDGYPPGQLLMLPPKFVVNCAPYSVITSTTGPTVGRGTADMNLTYDVEMPFSFIDPPLAGNFNYQLAPLYKRGGHNLFPPPPGAQRHFWYPATRTGANDSDSLYQPYDFHRLFTLMGANEGEDE